MKIYRNRAAILNPVTSLDLTQHQELKNLANDGAITWSTKTGPHGTLIEKFRAEVKNHYYSQQRRRCCYCSSELVNHKLTFDAEHILDKSDYPEYTFEEANIAVACKFCNQQKSNKDISASGTRFTEVSRISEDYSIVHPHLDDWNDHLDFDCIDRIIPVENSPKGIKTISICGLESLNTARFADYFSIDDFHRAEEALRTFQQVEDTSRKQELIELLDAMARHGTPEAITLVNALKSGM